MSKKQEPDFSSWALVDTFTVYQAACLWVGVDPSKRTADRSQLEISQVTPILEMLSNAIRDHVLNADSSRNLFENQGDYSSTRVTRSNLKAFADAKGRKPEFLFGSSTPSSEAEESLSFVAGTQSKAGIGRPPACSRELWLERFAMLALQGKVSLDDSQDAIAAVLSEDLAKQGIEVKAATIKKDWVGPIIRKAKDES